MEEKNYSGELLLLVVYIAVVEINFWAKYCRRLQGATNLPAARGFRIFNYGAAVLRIRYVGNAGL